MVCVCCVGGLEFDLWGDTSLCRLLGLLRRDSASQIRAGGPATASPARARPLDPLSIIQISDRVFLSWLSIYTFHKPSNPKPPRASVGYF